MLALYTSGCTAYIAVRTSRNCISRCAVHHRYTTMSSTKKRTLDQYFAPVQSAKRVHSSPAGDATPQQVVCRNIIANIHPVLFKHTPLPETTGEQGKPNPATVTL